ncbi:MAG: ADP-ribosylglycohydrolase family protein [Atopobiaceae bacterium]|nr:ADP-ribosylglycohydrolase family protein [Atopobiaceae bacterium]
MALRDAVYGLAVGDALGVPYEFKSRGGFRCEDMVGYGTHYQPAGTWSDDSSMALALADSIRVCGAVDTDDMRERFRAWIFDGEYTADGVVFDYGGTTYRALESGNGEDSEYSNGNGSLMRTAPLAYTDASDEDIRAVSAITHATDLCCSLCVDYVHLLRELCELNAETDDDVRLTRKAAWKASIREMAENAISEPDRGVGVDGVPESGGYVLHTYYAALWCFATTDSYRDCVLRAVKLGSDTDTTATVAGALAGEYYGIEAIPADWLEKLRGKDVIEHCLF